jgi:hypothetical protein
MPTPRAAVASLALGLVLAAGARADQLFPAPRANPLSGCGVRDTLGKILDQSKVVLYVRARNPRDFGNGQGATDLVLVNVLKGDPFVAGKRAVELDRVIPIKDPNNPPHFVVFADVFKGKLDVFRGIEASPATVDYLQGRMTLGDQDRQALLRYCFRYLEHPEQDLALDALVEFLDAPDAALRRVAAQLPADRLRAWLSHGKTDRMRVGLYGFLLGHCGTAQDADLLGKLIQEHAKDPPTNFAGLLCGRALLRPREGWAEIEQSLQDLDRQFVSRYAALQAVRFFHDSRPDMAGRAEVLRAMAAAMNDPDMADFAVEDLRRWREWQLTDHVLSLAARKSHDVPVVRRAVLRYTLQCPDPQAARFVAECRRRDPQWVADTEDLLKLELDQENR